MDPATVIALCKENIQPLRYGRNATQLDTALRAQDDLNAQQLLMQEKQMYEDAIKDYEGDDPLENWYEYILWIEQSYPKSGHESPIARLLQQCLAIFEKEIKYHQDRRYIRLWINYISMQKNPLELYQLLFNNGIGTRVADMYRAWAFELEQLEDYKRADEAYLMGLSAHAEPIEELEYAHQNFQLAVARKTLGHMDDKNEISLIEQRQAFSSLRAIKAGKKVTSIRTGQRVREYFPGTVPQIAPGTHGAKGNSRIAVYEDGPVPDEMKGSSILDHVPVEDSVHKENTIKPGPWNNSGRKSALITSSVKTPFKVHEDEDDNSNFENIRLFPNHVTFFDGSKYEEHKLVPVFVMDPPNPNVILKPHYPKEMVYANNIDRSMEEIRAEVYFQRKAQISGQHKVQELSVGSSSKQQSLDNFEQEVQSHDMMLQEMQRQRELIERQTSLEQQTREAERLELERQRVHIEKQQDFHITQYNLQNQSIDIQRHRDLNRSAAQNEQRLLDQHCRQSVLERQKYEIERCELARLEAERIEAERIEAERIEAERIEAQRMEAELDTQRKLQSSSFMRHVSSSLTNDQEDHLLGQSLTVNTKEAMNAVQDLWQSPEAGRTEARFCSPLPPRMLDSRNKLSFDIHMDSSMTQQHAMSNNKIHLGYNIQAYNDQENHQNYPTFSSQEQHTSYEAHELHNPYHYQMHQQHHDQQIQRHHLMQHPSHSPLQHPPPHHLQSPSQLQHSSHMQPQHYQSPSNHHQMQHMQPQPQQQPVYENDPGYPQYATSLESPLSQQNLDHQKQLQMLGSYHGAEVESNKAYRMLPELPYIKSPTINRRELKYVESAEDKENAVVIDYNNHLEDNLTKPNEENLYIDESGINPLCEPNETIFTAAFTTPLTSSTPMTNHHFKHTYRTKDALQFPIPNVPIPTVADVNAVDDDKLSVILESTREYISSSSGSSGHTRTTGLGFTSTKEDLMPIKEQSIEIIGEPVESLASVNQPYEQRMRAQIQAVHAQSPRTVQRNVDQITSDIKYNCDLKKSINFKIETETMKDNYIDSMECEEHEPMEQVEEEDFQIPSGDINPFDKNLIAGLLRKLKFPQSQHAEGYHRIDTNINKLVPSTITTLGSEAYDLEKCLGKGMYGQVFKAVDLQTGRVVALKTQKPAWIWEFYIAREIKTRLTNPHMLRGFMDVSKAYIADNASVLVSEYSKYGTLLAVTNQIKLSTGKPLTEYMAMFFTSEMIHIVDYLHKCQIIHGDIKPDNFLLMRLPTEDVRPTIQLIDFGCSIDMSLLPKNTTFEHVIKTEDFTCIEMQTGKRWTYQTDLYCLAATSHCLLFGNYMRVSKFGDHWFINSKLPRYVKKPIWERFFTELLNVESCDQMPDLGKLRISMEEILSQLSDVQNGFRTFANILNKR